MKYPKAWMNWLVAGLRIGTLGSLTFVGLYALFCLQVVRLPENIRATETTFSPGDRLLIKLPLPFSRFSRGDLVLYREEGLLGLGRVLGLPGERLEFGEGKFLVNGCEVDWPFLPADNDVGASRAGPLEVGRDEIALTPGRPGSDTGTAWRLVPLEAVLGVVLMRL